MSQNNSAVQQDHFGGLLSGLMYAVLAAVGGYAIGYGLLLLAGQNYIIAYVANLTGIPPVQHIVTAQYAGASILPYLFAFLFAVFGLAYGYLKHR